MNIAGYNEIRDRYNSAWGVVRELRRQVQAADSYLNAYAVMHRASELHFSIKPNVHIDPTHWPTADEILQAITRLKDLGEQVTSAFNRLPHTDRYLVSLPSLTSERI